MATISKYTQPIQNSLEQYIPLPFDEMMRAGTMIQQRGDLAEQQQMQVETGLGSMEALAPGYSQFRDTFVNDYKKQAAGLLGKFGGNTSDPEFIRASKKLNLTFAADPRLQTIKQGNELIKSQQKIGQELAARGTKVIDPNRGFTGLDQNGRLIVPTGSIRGTNFDEDLTKSFMQIRDNMIDNGRGWKTNKPNLDRLAANLDANLTTNPVTRDAIDYYKQQGLSDTDARKATQGLIRQAYTDNLRTDRDYTYDQLQIARERLSLDKMELAAKALAKTQQGTGLVPNMSPVDTKNLNTSLIKDVNTALKNSLNSVGGVKKARELTIDDTPANREKYAGKFRAETSFTPSTGIAVTGGTSTKVLKVKNDGYDPNDLELMRVARQQLGSIARGDSGGYLKDKTVLERYKEFLEKDNAAYTFWTTTSGDQLKQLNSIYVGDNGEMLGDATLIDRDGKLQKVTNKDTSFKGFKSFNFSGISAAPSSDFPNGAIKVSALDDEGHVVQFLKPLDPQTASIFGATNKGYKALTSGKTNKDIAKDRKLWIDTDQGILVPQKRVDGGVDLHFIDPTTDQLSDQVIPLERYEQAERAKFNNYLTAFSNKG